MAQERLPYQHLTGSQAIRPPSEARPRIVQLRAQGYSWQRIASRLNVDGIATPTGTGRWYSSSVFRHANPARHNAYMRDYRARRHE